MPERERQDLDAGLADAPRAEFRTRLRQDLQRRIVMTMTRTPAMHTVTPYVSVADVDRSLSFAREVFGAHELRRTATTGGLIHSVVSLGDSRLLFAGGPALPGRETVATLHVYVPDVDETYRQALEAGATALAAPRDKPYGARDATVKDPVGNLWFIATRRAGVEPPVRLRTVTPWLIAEDALDLIDFLKQAFGATEVGIHKSPDGRLLHGALSIGDSVLEFGQTEGVPPAAFHLFVPDAEALFEQAVRAGATSVAGLELAHEVFGRGSLVVDDRWGNRWYIGSEAPFGSR